MIHATAQTLADPYKAVMLAAEQLVKAAGFHGGHGVRRPGAGDDFWAYAPYRAGDNRRQIDWRRSARSEALIIRQTERLNPRTLTLWCDPSAGMDWSSDAQKPTKKSVGLCLSMASALVFARGGERIAIGTGCWSGKAVQEYALRHLNDQQGEPMPTQGADILIISDGLDKRWITRWQALSSMRIRGVLALVSDPAERDFPYTGAVAFEGMAGHRQHLLHDARAVQDAYRSAYRAQMDNMVRDAQLAGLTVVHIDSHASLEPGFAAIVHALSGQSV